MHADRIVVLGAAVSNSSAGIPEDVSFAEELVELLLDEFTTPDDVVLDPFAGFGTTLVVAERMGRRGIGLELLAERVDHIRGRVADPNSVFQHDARDLARLSLPRVAFSLSSPPYMTRMGHPQNPLTAYATLDGDYRRYLDELRSVYSAVADRLLPRGRVVINVADIVSHDHETALAHDLTTALEPVLRLTETIEIQQLSRPDWLAGDYCLVFEAAGT